MESNKKYVIGLDFGTDSCRALVVDTYTGREMATGVSFYPRWKAGLYCDAHNNRYRQHPLDYIESMTEAVHIALSDLKEEEDFLSEGDYQATIYTDVEDVERNPNNLDRQVRKVTRKDIIELNLARDGGALLHITKL